MSSARTSPGYYVAVVILAGLLLGAVVLVVAMAARPGAPGASVLVVTERSPVDCTPEHRDTTCFDTLVTNNGEAYSGFSCRVRSTDGAQATFPEGEPATQVFLDVDQSLTLTTRVVSDLAEPTPPSVSCEPIPL